MAAPTNQGGFYGTLSKLDSRDGRRVVALRGVWCLRSEKFSGNSSRVNSVTQKHHLYRNIASQIPLSMRDIALRSRRLKTFLKALPGSTPALFMRIKSAFWYSKCAFNAHKKLWCATWALFTQSHICLLYTSPSPRD